MNKRIQKHTQEEEEKLAREEEKAAERDARRVLYYHDDNSYSITKRRPHIFLFRPEDLDNEEVILPVENTPTYRRTQQMVNELRRRIKNEQETARQREEEEDSVHGTISFT